MKLKLMAKFLLAALTLASTVAIAASTARSQSAAGNTTFSCGKDKATGQLATLAQKGTSTVTLIVWSERDTFFGDKYTPTNRCNIVTSKLNSAASANGRSLQNLLLANGLVNNETAICVLNGGATACTPSNILFKLNPENASRSGAILGQLLKLGAGNVAANAIQNASGGQVYVNLGVWETGVMGSAAQR